MSNNIEKIKVRNFSLTELQKQINEEYNKKSKLVDFDDDTLPKGAKQQRPLTIQQKIFCEEYIKDFNATEAGIRAGYSPKSVHSTTYKLLKKEVVQEYIRELKKEVKMQSFWTIAEIERRLMELYDEIAADENPSRKDQIKILELAMKYKGMFNEQTTNYNQQVNILFTEVQPNLNYNIKDGDEYDDYTEE